MYTEIQSYRIFLDSGSQKNRSFTTINLFDTSDNIIGTIEFFEEEFQEIEPQDVDHVHIQYPISKFAFIVDILRNEKPLFIGYSLSVKCNSSFDLKRSGCRILNLQIWDPIHNQ